MSVDNSLLSISHRTCGMLVSQGMFQSTNRDRTLTGPPGLEWFRRNCSPHSISGRIESVCSVSMMHRAIRAEYHNIIFMYNSDWVTRLQRVHMS